MVNISEIIINLLVYLVGPMSVVIGAFLYGINRANKDSRAHQLEEEKKIQSEVNKAEQENANLEGKRHENNDAIRNSNVVSELIRLWNEKGWGPKS